MVPCWGLECVGYLFEEQGCVGYPVEWLGCIIRCPVEWLGCAEYPIEVPEYGSLGSLGFLNPSLPSLSQVTSVLARRLWILSLFLHNAAMDLSLSLQAGTSNKASPLWESAVLMTSAVSCVSSCSSLTCSGCL